MFKSTVWAGRRFPVIWGNLKCQAEKSARRFCGCMGQGSASSSLANAIKGADAGMLSMDINAHGIPNGKPAQFYKDLTQVL